MSRHCSESAGLNYQRCVKEDGFFSLPSFVLCELSPFMVANWRRMAVVYLCNQLNGIVFPETGVVHFRILLMWGICSLVHHLPFLDCEFTSVGMAELLLNACLHICNNKRHELDFV